MPLLNTADQVIVGRDLASAVYSGRDLVWTPDPAVQLLADAALWLDASMSGGGQTLRNLGTGGAALDAQSGSSAGADTNDPKFLAHTGTNYVYLPGVAGNALTVPHAAGQQAGDVMDVRVDITRDAWTAAQNFIGKGASSGAANAYSWLFGMLTSDRLMFQISDGTSAIQVIQTVLAGVVTAGGRIRLRATYTRDTGAGAYEVKFYKSTDTASALASDTTWTQLGTTSTGSSIGATLDYNAALTVGAFRLADAGLDGNVYAASVGIAGTPTVVLNTGVITSGSATSFTATTGQTVTINRSTAGRKSVAVVAPCWLLGTDDYFEVADSDLLDFAAGDSFTVLVVHRSWATFATANTLIAKKANNAETTAGWGLSGGATAAQIRIRAGDGTAGTTAVSGSRTSGAVSVVAGVRNVGADTFTMYLNGTAGTPVTDASTTSLANADVMRIGRLSGAGTEYADGEFEAVAVWRKALNASERALIQSYYTARWS